MKVSKSFKCPFSPYVCTTLALFDTGKSTEKFLTNRNLKTQLRVPAARVHLARNTVPWYLTCRFHFQGLLTELMCKNNYLCLMMCLDFWSFIKRSNAPKLFKKRFPNPTPDPTAHSAFLRLFALRALSARTSTLTAGSCPWCRRRRIWKESEIKRDINGHFLLNEFWKKWQILVKNSSWQVWRGVSFRPRDSSETFQNLTGARNKQTHLCSF